MDINLGNVPPIFAHDVALSTITKSKKTKKGNIKKESFTEMIFVDAVRKSALARIVLPMSVLEELPKLIGDNIKKIKNELKSKDVPNNNKEDKEEIRTVGGYVG